MNDKNRYKIAVFDIDRTLLSGTSAEELLVRFLLKRKILSIFTLIRTILKVLKAAFRGLPAMAMQKSTYLRGIHTEQIFSLLDEFMDECIMPRLRPDLVEWTAAFKKDGYKVFIISGTLDFVVNALQEKLGADDGIGSFLEKRNNRFTGRILGAHPYRTGKLTALNHLIEFEKVDWEHSWAFADSPADIPLLRCFGNPVTVNPGIKMKYYAKKYGWKILSKYKDAG